MVQDSRPTFVPSPGCTYRPIYTIAQQIARDLIYGNVTDGDNYRPPTIPEHLREEALAAGYVMIAAELLDRTAEQSDPEAELVIFPANYMDALCRVMVLISADRHTHEIDNALHAFVDAQERYSECLPDERPASVAKMDQADAHFDRLSWEALVRHDLAPYPSLLFTFLTTEDPSCAVTA
jgi:hypothetical protein